MPFPGDPAPAWREPHFAAVYPSVVATIAIRDEAAELLRELLRVDTVNPPGNETRAAELLRDYLGDKDVR